MDFLAFKRSHPARAIFRSMDLDELLEVATTWTHLRRLVVAYNDPDVGRFVEAVRLRDGTASSGERVLLHAICFVTDFAWLADELAAGKAWRHMDDAGGEWKQAVAACIGAEMPDW